MGEIFLVAPKYGHQIWVLAAEVTLVAGTGTGPGLRWLSFVTTDHRWEVVKILFGRLNSGYSIGSTGVLHALQASYSVPIMASPGA